jgi:hypothetical protein
MERATAIKPTNTGPARLAISVMRAALGDQ